MQVQDIKKENNLLNPFHWKDNKPLLLTVKHDGLFTVFSSVTGSKRGRIGDVAHINRCTKNIGYYLSFIINKF